MKLWSARVPFPLLVSLFLISSSAVAGAAAGSLPSEAGEEASATASANGRLAFSRLTGSDRDVYTVQPDGSGETQVSAGPDLDEQAVWSPSGSELLVTSEDGVQVHRDIVYATPGGVSVYTDIYLPPSPFGGPRPGIVIPVFQGFLASDRNHPGTPDIARSFAGAGYVVYVFSIRTWTEGHLYPAAEEDARALVTWVRANASSWNTDPGRLGAFGGSGGGYLAAVLGYKGGGDLGTGTRVRAVASWSGPMTLWQHPISSNNQRAAGYLGCDPLSGHATPECVQLGKDASPTEMVSSDDPPALIRNSTDEQVPLEQPRAMKASLEAGSIPLDYEEVEGTAHSVHLKKTEFDETLAYFDQHLLSPGESSNPHGTGLYRMGEAGDDRTALIDEVAAEGDPSWSPDGETVAFGSEGEADQEIYAMPAAGGATVNLSLSHSSNERQPDWSPEGTRIAFITDRLGSPDLFTMAADGSDPTPLVVAGEGLANPDWSPDGTRIAFERRAQSGTDLYLVNADGSGLVRLTNVAGDDREPAWSPDGLQIAFSSNRSGSDDIYVMNADGTGVTQVTSDPRSERHPDWQPVVGVNVLDAAVVEGDAGTGSAQFDVRLSSPTEVDVQVTYATAKGTATAPSDYTGTSGTLTIPAGQMQATVEVPIVGDLATEPHEVFFLDLRDAAGAAIKDGRGAGSILDNDGPCTIRGTAGHDLLGGTDGPDYMCGFGGNDQVVGGGGDDVILGGAGRDVLGGAEGNDKIEGGTDADSLQGEAGDDQLFMVDRVQGNDSGDGGEGTDTARADPGDTVVNCP
jgi:Tol biopolymer transport system component/dienelactone hydrolase